MKGKEQSDVCPEDECPDRLKRSGRRKRRVLVEFSVIVSFVLVGMLVFRRQST